MFSKQVSNLLISHTLDFFLIIKLLQILKLSKMLAFKYMAIMGIQKDKCVFLIQVSIECTVFNVFIN